MSQIRRSVDEEGQTDEQVRAVAQDVEANDERQPGKGTNHRMPVDRALVGHGVQQRECRAGTSDENQEQQEIARFLRSRVRREIQSPVEIG